MHKWVGTIAKKTERTQIHFLSDVLTAVRSLALKVPIKNTPLAGPVPQSSIEILKQVCLTVSVLYINTYKNLCPQVPRRCSNTP